MNPIRKFLGQTAIYGLSTIIGRLLNFLLVPLYVSLFDSTEYGKVSYLYALVVFLIVILTYGMETTFFRFREKQHDPKEVFGTGAWSLLVTSSLFLGLALLFRQPLAAAVHMPDHPEYITWFAAILALDAVVALPFARLRAEGKAFRFAVVKLTNIGLNIGFNLLFLLAKVGYDPSIGIGYIFISNLIASAITFALLLPEARGLGAGFSMDLWKKMIAYSWPLMIAGLASAINEVADRQIMNFVLPKEEAFSQIGIYSACYKLSIFMTLFIQAYRYGAEPFFFAKAKDLDARETYAELMNLFIIATSLIFVGLHLFIDPLSRVFIPNPEYYEGLHVVPILLLANLFLGVYINLSIWYKLSDKTINGAIISTVGAIITITLNFAAIPLYGYTAAAWVTLAAYAVMMIISLIWGQRVYPIPYDFKRMFGYLALSVLVVVLAQRVLKNTLRLNIGLFLIFGAILAAFEHRYIRRWTKKSGDES